MAQPFGASSENKSQSEETKKMKNKSPVPQTNADDGADGDSPDDQVQPLEVLFKYPLSGTGGNGGSIKVTLEDYKTLAAGTFLNDTIIDFYMKHLQSMVFSEMDRNR